ncbi:hypothetical protein IFM89_029979 [Coptis chinensis]|uniref:Uncharacterized protein n=1 Tax=Coptis chinensis TaxID=261450 RepID=A0A835IH91_9MAGN|nr:hypothetical protein IFM89_029979 [Coptis chinensis]
MFFSHTSHEKNKYDKKPEIETASPVQAAPSLTVDSHGASTFMPVMAYSTSSTEDLFVAEGCNMELNCVDWDSLPIFDVCPEEDHDSFLDTPPIFDEYRADESEFCVTTPFCLGIFLLSMPIRGEQVYIMCTMEELMPSIGMPVPSPMILAVVLCQSESTLRSVGNFNSDMSPTSVFSKDHDSHTEFPSESHNVSKSYLISLSDDGNVWSWLLTAEGARDPQKVFTSVNRDAAVTEATDPDTHTNTTDSSIRGSTSGAVKDSEPMNDISRRLINTMSSNVSFTFKVCNICQIAMQINLVGQLHLLSSTVTVIAVPSPSLTATLAQLRWFYCEGGGNNPAVAVPLVALGTQGGTIDVIDVSTNAVAASFSVHNTLIRGLRWLGNSRLVSFSYSQVNEKAGGYVNRLIVTCVRSGLNRTFRVLQKPERAPIRALRASSSGRLTLNLGCRFFYLLDPFYGSSADHGVSNAFEDPVTVVVSFQYVLIMFRDAPVEVWAMTKSPIMLSAFNLSVCNYAPFNLFCAIPRPSQNVPSSRQSSKERTTSTSAAVESPTKSSLADSKATSQEGATDDTSESFAFALVNGALGVFEVHGRRIRDFRPKWPSSSLVSSDGLVTAMAYRLPHVVMGDRSGNIRWWDVTTGVSSSFNTHREGIRRIKFSPVVAGDRSRGRIAVLFYDNTFSLFDLVSIMIVQFNIFSS